MIPSDPWPTSVCFRVTRVCNARCGFCLAPPDGAHPDDATLARRVDWLAQHGVSVVHFCGGEPTVHPGLPALLSHAHAAGVRTKLTTNGIAVSERIVRAARDAGTAVKVSIHGARERHDAAVGLPAHERAVATVRALLAANVDVTVQTTVVPGGEEALVEVSALCLALGVRRWSVLPCIPRGRGGDGAQGLDPTRRRRLREQVKDLRRALSGRLEVRWLDFASRPVWVLEADGTLVVEGSREALDRVVGRIDARGALPPPEGPSPYRSG